GSATTHGPTAPSPSRWPPARRPPGPLPAPPAPPSSLRRRPPRRGRRLRGSARRPASGRGAPPPPGPARRKRRGPVAPPGPAARPRPTRRRCRRGCGRCRPRPRRRPPGCTPPLLGAPARLAAPSRGSAPGGPVPPPHSGRPRRRAGCPAPCPRRCRRSSGTTRRWSFRQPPAIPARPTFPRERPDGHSAPKGGDRQGHDPIVEREYRRAGVEDDTSKKAVAQPVPQPDEVPGIRSTRRGRGFDFAPDHPIAAYLAEDVDLVAALLLADVVQDRPGAGRLQLGTELRGDEGV